ncbi:DUF3180 family protein [Actinomyces faecalis]|uniref:DUF3180 family protein n=1 Tax=Actinomyces faecalis TaxID=2722820 RepID=UPI001554FD3F|nr:DUF3180 family protein [Actinomyces faecalis]
MHRTRWTGVLACFVTSVVVSWVVVDLVLRHRGWVPALTPWGAAVALTVALVVLVAGQAVRRLRAHRPTWMTPTGAAVTAAAAQASALVGAVVGGVYGGELAVALVAPASPAMDSLGLTAAGCLVASLVWCACGLVVEHWCAIDMSDDDDEDGSQGAVPSGGATA